MPRRFIPLFSLFALLTFSSLSAQPTPPPENSRVAITKAFPALSFSLPVDLQPLPGTDKLCLVEQTGRVLIFENRDDVEAASFFLDIHDRVGHTVESGLLGLAFDPQFELTRSFYVYYAAENPLRNVVSRFRMKEGSLDSADPASEEVILSIPDPYPTHNGGQIRFGPDGYLYIGVGDGGGDGDPENRAQNLGSFFGKMLRIDVQSVDSGMKYAIPPSNPYAQSWFGIRKEIYASGLRNPWRWSFDPRNPSRMWIADVGQATWEEVNLLTKPGQNFGWRITEGRSCYSEAGQCDSAGITMPLLEYRHDTGQCITGGFVYRGASAPALLDRYIYGDFVKGHIWSLHLGEDGTVDNRLVANSGLNISAFGEDADSELYFLAFDGHIYKFTTPAGVERETGSEGLQLRAIVPNPARDRTTIRFSLDHRSDVKITLFDQLGRALKTVKVGVMEEGDRECSVDLSGLPSGRLTLRLCAGEHALAHSIEHIH